MVFNRGEVRVKSMNIGEVNRKRGRSITGRRITSGAITTTLSAHIWL